MTYLGRVVVDCNVVLQALASERGPAFECLAAIEGGAAELVWSDEVMFEYRAVLARPELHRKLRMLSPARIDAMLTRLRRMGTQIDPVPHLVRFDRDPGDEPYLNLAVTSSATYLVSRDNDLLDLKKDPLPAELHQHLAKLSIVDPPEFLRRCRVE